MNVTLLMSACRRQSKKLVNFLLSRGAKVNVTDEFGRTALMYAAMKGHEEIFTLLMEHNADVKKQDCFGQAVIHYAAIYNHKPILLMGPCCRPIGANVDIEDIDGCTALWWSAYHGYVDCADALFVHGADPVKKNKSNESPLGIAKKNGHTAVVSMITRALNSPSLKHAVSVTMAMYEEPV
jgi:ankyrin repeat protein